MMTTVWDHLWLILSGVILLEVIAIVALVIAIRREANRIAPPRPAKKDEE